MRPRLIALLLLCLLAAGCAPQYGPPLICTTNDHLGGNKYYLDGVPIVDFATESFGVALSMTPAMLAQLKVMRVDLTVRNVTEQPMDFDPGKDLRLQVIDVEMKHSPVPPLPPHIVKTVLGEERANKAFATRLVGAFRSASYAAKGDNLTAEYIADSTREQADSFSQLSEMYADQLAGKMLRRNTVFPGEMVTGTVYFQLPHKLPWRQLTKDSFVLGITLPEGERLLEFEIIPGDWGPKTARSPAPEKNTLR